MQTQFDWLKAVKEYAKDYMLENTGLKVLALLITVVLWLSVASRPVSEITMYNVPIEFKNLPESTQLIVSKVDSPSPTARVYLRGPRDVLDTLRISDLAAYADLNGVEPGVRVVTLQLDSTRLPASLLARVVEPRSIRVTVERVVEREVPVKPRLEGEPPAGYEVISKTISPPTVRIVGAASQVREINEVSTETLSLTDRTAPFSEGLTIDVGNPNVTVKKKDDSSKDESFRRVMLTGNIGEIHKERVIDRIPISIEGATGAKKSGTMFARVTLFGASSAVDAITADDIAVTIDNAGAGGAREAAVVAMVSPPYADRVSVRSVYPKTVRVR